MTSANRLPVRSAREQIIYRADPLFIRPSIVNRLGVGRFNIFFFRFQTEKNKLIVNYYGRVVNDNMSVCIS